MFGVDPIGYLVQIIKSLNTSGCHRFPERNDENFEFLKICMHHMLGKRPIPDKNRAAFSQQLQTFVGQWKIGPRLTLKNWIDLLNILYEMQITIKLIINTSRWFKFARKAAMDRRLFSPPWRRGNKMQESFVLSLTIFGKRKAGGIDDSSFSLMIGQKWRIPLLCSPATRSNSF